MWRLRRWVVDKHVRLRASVPASLDNFRSKAAPKERSAVLANMRQLGLRLGPHSAALVPFLVQFLTPVLGPQCDPRFGTAPSSHESGGGPKCGPIFEPRLDPFCDPRPSFFGPQPKPRILHCSPLGGNLTAAVPTDFRSGGHGQQALACIQLACDSYASGLHR